ncbi:MAG: hypothetical protein AB7G11_04850 [Phycisphaerales bacterium]
MKTFDNARDELWDRFFAESAAAIGTNEPLPVQPPHAVPIYDFRKKVLYMPVPGRAFALPVFIRLIGTALRHLLACPSIAVGYAVNPDTLTPGGTGTAIAVWCRPSRDTRVLVCTSVHSLGNVYAVSVGHVVLWRQAWMDRHLSSAGETTPSWWLTLAEHYNDHFDPRSGLYGEVREQVQEGKRYFGERSVFGRRRCHQHGPIESFIYVGEKTNSLFHFTAEDQIAQALPVLSGVLEATSTVLALVQSGLEGDIRTLTSETRSFA